MECRTAIEYINLYVDNMLAENEAQILLEHIRSCESCKKELEDITALKNRLAELDELEPPAGLALSAIKKAKKKKLPIFAYASAGIAAAIALAVIFTQGTADGMRSLKSEEKASYYGESADYAADEMFIMEAPKAEASTAAGATEMLEGAAATMLPAEDTGEAGSTRGLAAYTMTVPPESKEEVMRLIEAYIGEHAIEAEQGDIVISFIVPEEHVKELEAIIAKTGTEFENAVLGGLRIEFIFE